MTRDLAGPELRQIRLLLYLSRRQVTWALLRRTTRGDYQFDTRVDSGSFRPPLEGTQPETVLLECARALQDAFRKNGIPWPEASREPRGAVGGGSTDLRHNMEEASGVSTDGQPLDVALPGL